MSRRGEQPGGGRGKKREVIMSAKGSCALELSAVFLLLFLPWAFASRPESYSSNMKDDSRPLSAALNLTATGAQQLGGAASPSLTRSTSHPSLAPNPGPLGGPPASAASKLLWDVRTLRCRLVERRYCRICSALPVILRCSIYKTLFCPGCKCDAATCLQPAIP